MTFPAIGIDLGTTYSVVAVFRNGIAEIIANDQGNRVTPSCVAFQSHQKIVGEAALYQAAENPTNTIYGVKRLMGRKFTDAAIQSDIRAWPFKVVNENDKIKIETSNGARYSPEQVSAEILGKMKKTAETFLGVKIKDVVITCPAYFNNSQREATKDAAEIAGLNVLRMINEPTAAAFAYGLNANNVGRKNILIFDFGGGTFDVTILTIKGKDYKVRATNGDTHLGGEDFDQRMVEYFVSEFKRKNNRDIRDDKALMRNLKTHCERIKCILSVVSKADIALDGTNLSSTLTRARFEDINYDLFEKSITLVAATLREAEMNKSEIDEVVLVGGSSRIPKIQEMLSDFFNGKALNKQVNLDEAVALGAAIQAGMLQDNLSDRLKGLKLCDVCPLSLGSEVYDGSVTVIIKRNTPIPVKACATFTTVYDNQTSASVEIYEGERIMAKDNHFLGKFLLTGIPAAPQGKITIRDTYEIDENGILKVTAMVLGSGISKSLTITNQSRMSKVDSERMVNEAKKHKDEDLVHKERIAAYKKLNDFISKIKCHITEIENPRIKQKAKSRVGQYSSFLLKNPLAPKEELERQYEELRRIWNRTVDEHESYLEQKRHLS